MNYSRTVKRCTTGYLPFPTTGVVIFYTYLFVKLKIFLANTDNSDDDEFEATKDIENIHIPSFSFVFLLAVCRGFAYIK
jgi:hypothetical protein